MGYLLRRWLADTLPDTIAGGNRLVALEIADQANDETRVAYGRDLLEIVARRCGLQAASVSKALQRLGLLGWEMRVQVGTDKDNRPVYAHAGHQTTYRVPEERADARLPFERSVRKEGQTTVRPKGRPLSGLRADDGPGKGGPPSAPSPQVSSSSPHSSPQVSDTPLRSVSGARSEIELWAGELHEPEAEERSEERGLHGVETPLGHPAALVSTEAKPQIVTGELEYAQVGPPLISNEVGSNWDKKGRAKNVPTDRRQDFRARLAGLVQQHGIPAGYVPEVEKPRPARVREPHGFEDDGVGLCTRCDMIASHGPHRGRVAA